MTRKLAIVHDFLNQYGGAEKVLESLHEAFPAAPIFTSVFLPEHLPPVFRAMDVRTSFMQSFPLLKGHYKKFLPFYPGAIESLDLSGFDMVLSSSSAFAKGARAPAGVPHLCYCYTPMRFVWTPEDYFEKERIFGPARAFMPYILRRLKKWDLSTTSRVHRFISISRHIQARIRACWNRPSEVVYPPVDVEAFPISPEDDGYYLTVSRLNAHKRVDLAIQAMNRLKKPLVVVGWGGHEKRLKALAGPTVRFLGSVSQETLVRVVARCRAFIHPGEEDFGIAPVEAMACGKPVIAYGAGGVLETVVDGETGLFFREQSVESLADAVLRFERTSFDPARIRRGAEAFDKEVFKRRVRDIVAAC